MSASLNALHNDHHIISAMPNSSLCPVKSYKRYLNLLHPDIDAFFQYPNKSRKGFNKEAIGKNMLGVFMKEISKKANLNKIYTNHQIRKTTATGMRRSGFTLEQIAHVTKHKNLDSLKHYVDGPTMTDKENYNKGLFRYANPNHLAEGITNHQITKKQKVQEEETPQEPLAQKENVQNTENNAITIPEVTVPEQERNIPNLQSVITNQVRQAPNLFQNASFANCNFTFTFPQ